MKKTILLLATILLAKIAFAVNIEIVHVGGKIALGEKATFRRIITPTDPTERGVLYWGITTPKGGSQSSQLISEVNVIFDVPGTYTISAVALRGNEILGHDRYTVQIYGIPSITNNIKIIKNVKGNYFHFILQTDNGNVESDVDIEFMVVSSADRGATYSYNVTMKKWTNRVDIPTNIFIGSPQLARITLRSARVSPGYDHMYQYKLKNTVGLEL
ncbi:MAG: hypothetical protein LBL90_07640 [Prevotellaceae bacterium]|jgi:hypothetical protein|nr:hypothetical protein [Prevotellaceae bacterium]